MQGPMSASKMSKINDSWKSELLFFQFGSAHLRIEPPAQAPMARAASSVSIECLFDLPDCKFGG